MIPDSVEPGLAPGGILALVFDLKDNEITRSVLTPERIGVSDLLAMDAGEAASERGGGRLVCYDGDTGERMFKGPPIVLDADGNRLPVTHFIGDFDDCVRSVRIGNAGTWPWSVVGVFSNEDTEVPGAWWNDFAYTVRFTPRMELWVPSASIEGRYAGPQIAAAVLNSIGAAMQLGCVVPGDTVRVPLGVTDAEDVDTYWWIGEVEDDPGRRGVYKSPTAEFVLPILWSSGLGWTW